MEAFCGVRGEFMRNVSVVALFFLLTAGVLSGQQTTQSVQVKVYAVGSGVTAPELLPLNLSLFPTEKCGNKVDGKVTLSLLVDATGKPRNLMFIKPLGNDLDRYVLKIIEADRFNPGTSDGTPVVVGESVEVNIHACADQTGDDVINKITRLRLRSQPEQKFGDLIPLPQKAILASDETFGSENKGDTPRIYKVGDGISAPVLLVNSDVEYTDEARQAKYNGICTLSVIIDAQGMPQNIQVKQPVDYGMTENAIKALRHFRFKPAIKNGEPVPVEINFILNFNIG